jgi:hypothetical protein
MPREPQRHPEVAATPALIEYCIDLSALCPDTGISLSSAGTSLW